MIDIWKRSCKCCGKVATEFFVLSICGMSIELCPLCMNELHKKVESILRENDMLEEHIHD